MTGLSLAVPDAAEQAARALADTDALLATAYPGDDGARQPVHTVYVPADRYTADLPQRWANEAVATVERLGGFTELCEVAGVAAPLVAPVATAVERKLTTEPIEDLRIDFEDGYGRRSDAEEDAAVGAVTAELARALRDGTAPPFVGLRPKCLEADVRARGLRTLDGFLTALSDGPGLPDGLRITLPKVSTVAQVEAFAAFLADWERAREYPPGRLRFEVQVETPPLVVGADGSLPVARILHAGGGRVAALHYGTYDYSATLGIAAAHQSLEHPAADFAKQVMQAAAAGTGVQLSDGSTNVVPAGEDAEIRAAWRLHARLVARALARGYYQGWDLHPAQLPTRFAATYAFYLEGFDSAARRISDYVTRTAGNVLDEPATVRALAGYVHRGLVCGATGAEQVTDATGLTPEQIAALALPGSDTETLTKEP